MDMDVDVDKGWIRNISIVWDMDKGWIRDIRRGW